MAEPDTRQNAWTRFWDDPRFSTRALALGRMVVSVILIEFALLAMRPFLHAPRARGFAEVFHLPYAAIVPALPYWVLIGVYALLAVCGLLALVGVTTRACLLASGAIVILGLLQDRLAFINHHHHLAVLCILLAFAPCADRWSVAAWWRGRRGVAPARTSAASWAARLLQLTTCLVYVSSAIGKTNSSWWSGDLLAAAQIENADGAARAGLGWATGLAPPAVWARLALITEYGLAFGLWYRRTRLLALAVGVAFHLSVEAGLAVGTFTGQMLASYLVFAGQRPATDESPPSNHTTEERAGP